MQCSKRAVCFYLIGTPYETKTFRVDAHPREYAKAHSFVTLPVVFAPIIFAENMVRCTEITTGEDLGVTGFCFWKTSERMQKRKPANCQNPA